MDIATEELSHLEIIGTLVGMLNKGAKGALAEGTESEAELYRSLTANGNDSHITSLLYGGGTPLTNSAGVPWTAAYIDTIGEPTADLRSNVAAEARAKIVYERLINVTDDPGVKDALAFLMTREAAHQLSFEKALQSIRNNYPPGKLPPISEYANTYYNMSEGGEVRGSWNSDKHFDYVKDPQGQRIALRVRLRSLQHRFAQRFLLWRQADRSTAISAVYARLWILDIIEVFVTVPAAAYFSTFRHIAICLKVEKYAAAGTVTNTSIMSRIHSRA